MGEKKSSPGTSSKRAVGRPKSETRRHTGMARMDEEALSLAKMAASLKKQKVADYLSELVAKHARADIESESKRVLGNA